VTDGYNRIQKFRLLRLDIVDFDGDGKTDIAVYRNGIWYIYPSGGGARYAIMWGETRKINLFQAIMTEMERRMLPSIEAAMEAGISFPHRYRVLHMESGGEEMDRINLSLETMMGTGRRTLLSIEQATEAGMCIRLEVDRPMAWVGEEISPIYLSSQIPISLTEVIQVLIVGNRNGQKWNRVTFLFSCDRLQVTGSGVNIHSGFCCFRQQVDIKCLRFLVQSI
jgi:hypothetical protein